MSATYSNISSSSGNSALRYYQSKIGTCANDVCENKVERLLKCGRCLFAEYCSRECQLKDWPQHKQVCALLKSADVDGGDKVQQAVRIVLQGEMAIVQPKNEDDGLIKTPQATTCHVVTLYEPEKKIGVLAHIDDYTEPVQAIQKIGQLIKERYNVTLGPNFRARVMGGSDNCVSKKHQKLILLALKKTNPKVLRLPTPRPQVLFNAYDGAIQFAEKENPGLEYLQRIEYGKWNTYLDLAFAEVNGMDIPYYEIKEANRYESEVPKLPDDIKVMDNATADMLLQSRTISIQTQWQRTPI